MKPIAIINSATELFILMLILVQLSSCSGQLLQKDRYNSPSDPKATTQTVKFYDKIQKIQEKGIMIGHQNGLAYGNNWFGDQERSDMKSVCGDYPAVFGWNLDQIENGNLLNIDSVSFDAIKDYTQNIDQLGGISIFSWSLNDSILIDREDTLRMFSVSAILHCQETKAFYLSYLDRVAHFLLQLKNQSGESIPIVFRLFHNGNTLEQLSTADEFKQLWRLTVDYLRDKKKLHHLLYLYSLNDIYAEQVQQYYPGNEYVDIIGINSHLSDDSSIDIHSFVQTLNRRLAIITSFAEKNQKTTAIMDAGVQGIKMPNFFSELLYPIVSQYKLSYILFLQNSWNQEKDYYIPVPGHPACDDFVRFINYPNIFTCKDVS